MKTIRSICAMIGLLFCLHATLAAQTGYKQITVPEAGALSSLLGEDWSQIDSLEVSGSVDQTDLKTVVRCLYLGQTDYADLCGTEVVGDSIASRMFMNEYVNSPQTYDHRISILLPDGICRIGAYAFAYALLSEIRIPGSVQEIGESAFAHCTSMSVLTMSEGVSKIGARAFLQTRIQYFDLPASLRSVGCLALGSIAPTTVICRAVVPPVVVSESGATALFDRQDQGAGLPKVLYVPRGSADLYRAAPGWCDVPQIIESDFTTGLPLPLSAATCRFATAGVGSIVLTTSPDATTPVYICGMDGRVVRRVSVREGAEVSLPAGAYCVKAGCMVQKLLVK